MNIKQRKKRSQRIQEKYQEMRDQLWPELDEQMLWDRRKKAGYTTIPRTMRYIQLIMDEMANGKPLGSTYLALWCRVYDVSCMVVINNQETMAFESGFTGQRAVTTWKSRMKRLIELEFIEAKPGAAGKFQYVLIWDPYKIIKKHLKNKTIPQNVTYNAFLDRAMEIGAGDDLTK